MAQREQAVMEPADRKIPRGQIETRLRLNGAWEEAVTQLTDETMAAQVAKEQGITVADKELQEDFDEFRACRGLAKAEDTRQWLQSTGLTLEQVEGALTAKMQRDKVAEKLISDKQIDSYYNGHPTEFEYARVSQIMVADKAAAEELALSVREREEGFAKLARKHSLDKTTRAGGGFLGLMTRRDTAGLPQPIADRIFAAKVGDVIGPFQAQNAYFLVKVEEVGKRPLDDDLRMLLREQLYGQWVAEKNGSNGSN